MAKPSRNYLFPNEISFKRSYKVDYDITDNLGSGAFGVVRKARSKEDPALFVAIKSIKKADCKPEELFAEVKLLRLLAGSKGVH
jgi:serine/threonine protein kinase